MSNGSNSTPPLTTPTPSMDHESGDLSGAELVVILFFLALLAVLIIVINCLVVILVLKKEMLRTQANICLASLACSDLLTGFCAIPLVMACSMVDVKWVCLAMDLINRFLSISAILHLLVIAVERYLVIVRFVRPSDFIGWRKYTVVVLTIWLVPLLASLIQLSWVNLSASNDNQKNLTRIEVAYDLVCIFGFALTPLLIIIIVFTRIFCILRRHGHEITKQIAHFTPKSTVKRIKTKERRATLIYASMIAVFTIGWFSYFLMTLSNDLAADGTSLQDIPSWADTILMFCRFSTSMVNPLLYTFFKRDFRQAIRSIKRGREHEAEVPPNSNSFQMRALRKCNTRKSVEV